MSRILRTTSLPLGSSSRSIAGPSRSTSPFPSHPHYSTKSLPTPTPTHYHITLLRSSIGLPLTSRETLSALGFGYGHHERKQSHKLHRSVLQPFSPTAAGQILRVKELVKVVNVTEQEGWEMIRQETYGRKESRGFVVEGKRTGGGGVDVSVEGEESHA